MTQPGSYWGTDTRISMPAPAKDEVLVDFGAMGFSVNGLVHNLSDADLEEYTFATFSPSVVTTDG